MKKLIIIILCFVSFSASAQKWMRQQGKHQIDTLRVETTSNNGAGLVMVIKDTIPSSPTFGKLFHKSITASESGTYTPTLTNTTNVAASTAFTTHYSMIGNTIIVWGTVSIDATASLTLTEMGFSLPPVAGTVTQIYDISGHATFEDNTSFQIKGDVTNGRAVFRGTPQSSSNNTYSILIIIKFIIG